MANHKSIALSLLYAVIALIAILITLLIVQEYPSAAILLFFLGILTVIIHAGREDKL